MASCGEKAGKASKEEVSTGRSSVGLRGAGMVSMPCRKESECPAQLARVAADREVLGKQLPF